MREAETHQLLKDRYEMEYDKGLLCCPENNKQSFNHLTFNN